jgi:folate-binding protein YgfZ
VINFPKSALIFPYSPACLLRIHGPDAAPFLQGQFTNDLGKIAPGQSVYGLWLDRRGRVLADSQVIASDGPEEFWVASVLSPAPLVARRLGEFIVADDVQIDDETGGWRGVALIGPGTGAWLAAGTRAGLVFPGRRAAGESWEWIHRATDADAVGLALAGAPAADPGEIERRRIAAGIPSVPADIGPGELPNEGGLDAGAISYSKGCYLGQEVMARLKSTGRVRRTLVRVRGPGVPPPLPAALWRGGNREGELRSAAPDPDGGGYAGLALVAAAVGRDGGRLAVAAGAAPTVEIARGV